jgi:hypothetical protein
MAHSIELNIPKSAAERASKSILNKLLADFKSGTLNTEQTVEAIEHWHSAVSAERNSGAEKQASDAPVWYSADEANAWANGYNAAIGGKADLGGSDDHP